MEKIANGEKTIEVRKTRPKLDTPFKCYIYCTQSGVALGAWEKHSKVIGEFTCDRIYKIDKDSTGFLFKSGGLSVYKQAAEEKCGLRVAMTDDKLHGYLGHFQGYGWHISNLKIYDTPNELSKFSRPFENRIDKVCDEFGCASCENDGHIKRPPQSWCYVEEM